MRFRLDGTIDPVLYRRGRRDRERLGEATVVTLYVLPSLNEKLMLKLQRS